MISRKTILVLWAVALSCSTLSAAPVLEVSAVPPVVPYQRSMQYTVIIEGGTDLVCEFPELATDQKLVETHRLGCENENIEDKGRRITQQYVLDPVFPGRYLVPSIKISWKEAGSEGVLETPPLAFTARDLTESEQKDIAEFAAIAAPTAVLPPTPISRVAVLTALVLAGIAGAALFAIAWRFRHKKELAAPPIPAWTAALHRLRELQQRDLPGAGRIDAYYVDLSSILRYYIEDRFFIHAPEQTTPEFLDAAARHGIFSEEQQAFLADFLHQCDRVKFAQLQPGVEDMNGHFKSVKQFIQNTIPKDAAEAVLEQAA